MQQQNDVAATAAASSYIIECENLVKIYKKQDIEVLALQGLDLTVQKGEIMAIIGNSGSGKSTLLNMVGGLDRPSAGKLFVGGKDLFKMTEPELVEYKAKTVGFVWQNNARNLLPYLTALENVLMPMQFDKNASSATKKQKALELLELVGISHRKNSRLNQMSGGEQQRVAIAIATANSPQILLADEPTGSVDANTSAFLLDAFRAINKTLGTTIVIVTHDRQIAEKVGRVVAIRDGKTSSEMISAAAMLEQAASFGDSNMVHEEYSILDRAGRLQIPAEYLQRMGIAGNKVKLEYVDGKVIISPPAG